ncbi:hypothetical protein PIB30_026671 [Stylosanthes scabra]|uniref:RNase H type-1 domain-containing protein n=1 Tax=Stylosanthes scabra TaxID=79078 RepID=A0ABU6ZB04_9FABA|nr:hypothetical protein [Stylosanthes scabra]
MEEEGYEDGGGRDWIKVNTDAAFSKDTKQGAISAVFRDCSGRLLTGLASKIKACSALAAEAESIRTAFIAIRNMNIDQVLIESDNLLLVQALKSLGRGWEGSSRNRPVFIGVIVPSCLGGAVCASWQEVR